MAKDKVRALVLLSGGLDSMLAVKVLQDQEIEVVGICFVSNFFDSKKAETAAERLGIKLIIADISDNVLALVKNPPSGYGKNLNPCIDCHSLMVRKAYEMLNPPTPLYPSSSAGRQGEKYDFIATGEVLGQRPFSQNKIALGRVMKLAGNEILRPLSAKLLPETEAEKNGLVNRHHLLDIEGRSRDRQMQLAEKYGLTDYPKPAGGCLLTDPEFSGRLLKMLDYWPNCGVNDIELLKNGRVFWFNLDENGKMGKILAVIGRDQAENERLNTLAKKGDFMVELINEVGPTGLIRIFNGQLEIEAGIAQVSVPAELKLSELEINNNRGINEIADIIKLLNCYYATRARGKEAKVEVKKVGLAV